MGKFKVDENLPAEVAGILRAAGHDAVSVLDQAMGGRPDDELASVCRREGLAMITLDLDFADIRAYPPVDYPGIVVLRLQELRRERILATIQRVAALFDREPLQGRLWIVGESSVRMRG